MKLYKSHGRMKEALSAPQLSAVSEETSEAARKQPHAHGLVRRDLSDSEDEDRSGDLLAMGMGSVKEGRGENEGEEEGEGAEQAKEEQEVRHDELYSHLMVSTGISLCA